MFNLVADFENQLKNLISKSSAIAFLKAEAPAVHAFIEQINWKAYATDLLAKYGVSASSAAVAEADAAQIVADIEKEAPVIEKELGI